MLLVATAVALRCCQLPRFDPGYGSAFEGARGIDDGFAAIASIQWRLGLACNSVVPIGAIVAEMAPPRQRHGRAVDRLRGRAQASERWLRVIMPTPAGGTRPALGRRWQACRQHRQSRNVAESLPLLLIPLPGPASPDSKPRVAM